MYVFEKIKVVINYILNDKICFNIQNSIKQL